MLCYFQYIIHVLATTKIQKYYSEKLTTEKRRSTTEQNTDSTMQSSHIILPPTVPPYSNYRSKTTSSPNSHALSYTVNKLSVVKTSQSNTKNSVYKSVNQSTTNKNMSTKKQAFSTNNKIDYFILTSKSPANQDATDRFSTKENIFSDPKTIAMDSILSTNEKHYLSTLKNDKNNHSSNVITTTKMFSTYLTSTTTTLKHFSKCSERGLFDCKTSTNDCIEKSLICDGYNDCSNGNDEQNCSKLFFITENIHIYVNIFIINN